LRRIDKQAFCRDILQSQLYGSQRSDADEYADLFDAEVTRVLEINAPLRTGRRRRSGQHDTYVLSDEAVEAERRYRRTGLPSDKQAFKAACNAARTSIMTSRADHIRTQLQQASGDILATWRTAQSLLHSGQIGYLRRLGMRGPRQQVQFVLRRQGQTHPGQHRVGATAVQPPDIRCTTENRSRVIGFTAGDYRRCPEADSVHTTQDIAAGRSACLSTE